MKEDVRRIMQLVKDGKLSPEDAAELIEAFQDAPDEPPPFDPEVGSTDDEETTPPPTEGEKSDPFSKLIGSIEKIGKDVADSVNWKDVSTELRTGVNKGVDALKKAVDEAQHGKGVFGSVFGSQVRKEVRLPLDVPKGKVFKIEGNVGDITVDGGYDIGDIQMNVRFKAYNEEEARTASERYTALLEETDDAIYLRHSGTSGVIADIKVKLAEGTPVELHTANGVVTCSATKASVLAKTSNGDIRVSEGGGVLELKTASGSVKVGQSSAKNVDIETKSGSITIEESQGAFNLRTSSGDVTLRESSVTTLAIDAASGNVDLHLTTPITKTATVRTVSGSVDIDLPEGSDARIALATLRGEVECDVELEDENKSAMKVTGVLGKGKGMLDASTVNGSVCLKVRETVVDGV